MVSDRRFHPLSALRPGGEFSHLAALTVTRLMLPASGLLMAILLVRDGLPGLLAGMVALILVGLVMDIVLRDDAHCHCNPADRERLSVALLGRRAAGIALLDLVGIATGILLLLGIVLALSVH